MGPTPCSEATRLGGLWRSCILARSLTDLWRYGMVAPEDASASRRCLIAADYRREELEWRAER